MLHVFVSLNIYPKLNRPRNHLFLLFQIISVSNYMSLSLSLFVCLSVYVSLSICLSLLISLSLYLSSTCCHRSRWVGSQRGTCQVGALYLLCTLLPPKHLYLHTYYLKLTSSLAYFYPLFYDIYFQTHFYINTYYLKLTSS